MRTLVGVVALLAVAVTAAPALAQSNTDMCGSNAEAYPPQQVVNACTALINGGGYGSADLAIIYSNRGNAWKRAGDLRSALTDQDTALQYNPSDGITYYNRGNTRLQMGDDVGALADYDIGVRFAPTHQPIWYQRGLTRYNRGDYQQSIVDTSEAIRLSPNHADSYTNRANGYIMTEQFPAAIADLNVAIRLEPNVALHRYNRGVANERAGNTQQAIADYADALRIDPRYASALGNRGNLKASNGDVPGGIADLTAALSIRESVIDLNNRAYAYVSTRDYARALADFDRAAVVAPNSHQYDNSRCWYRIMANTQLDVARAACDRGILGYANNPVELANILDSRGMLNLKQNRFQDAWDDYSAAMRADSSRASYPFGRGIAALRLGRTEEARSDFARAMAIEAAVAERYAGYGFPIDASLLPPPAR
ncbi:MAG: tetratricopeptide repeat protein [Hyphomonadaceae bacterium]|nr:tetratricopeptide repeat protein [Hyphomonadaceae bacterium]